ncbi:hypothetical protein PRK78_005660 [Emydomyces testavorans]|uniref:Uncharacterized protein n=1 Tax=Emydomyces testavorans TaxID=2070801 RepID=A0AAF0IJQ9_9EURO|nr:hypothetical protein PRK78_005660 [Emydomyces testavorans]
MLLFEHLGHFKLRAPWWKGQQDYATVKANDDESLDSGEPVSRSAGMMKLCSFFFVMLLILAFMAVFVSQWVFASSQPSKYQVQKANTNSNLASSQTMNPSHSYGAGVYHGHHPSSSGGGMRSILKSPCGTNATSARTAGCHFDIISFAWLHDKCYDAELSKSFSSIHEWKWFLQPNREQPLPASEALSGNYPVLYVNWEYHVRHCTYMWKKMHRAILKENGLETIDWYIAPYEHTEHCAEMLLSRGDNYQFDVINTGIRVKYPDCGIAV